MENKAEFVESIYKQRDKFILIGLTGRTGSGCSTVASILSKEKMTDLDLRSYKTCSYSDADERKYSVIYRFMKEGDKWKKFYVIEASSIILSFMLQDSFEHLSTFLELLNKKVTITGIEDLRQEIINLFTEEELKKINVEVMDGYTINNLTKTYLEKMDNGNLEKDYQEQGDSISDTLEKMVHFFTDDLIKLKRTFCDLLKRITVQDKKEQKFYNLYSLFMQEAGNNLRSSGLYYETDERAGKEVTIVERINSVVKLINRYEEIKCSITNKEIEANNATNEKQEKRVNERTRICIDALRNPLEVFYFRDRYRSFYALAISSEDEYRQNRLGMNKDELQSLDEIEQDKNDKSSEGHFFYHQNISACLEVCDIYIYNQNTNNHKYYELTEQLLKYIALILQPGLVTPTHIERCMQLAFNAKYNSGCLSRQVGAVVTGEDFSVRSVGWNDVPKGQVPCNLRCVEDYCRNKDPETFSEFELTDETFGQALMNINEQLQQNSVKDLKTGKKYSYCFKDIYNGIKGKNNQVYTRALHAEENAFLQISKYGGAKIEGGKLFTTASPCELCSKKAYQLGIKEIYYIDPYPGISKSHILSFGKIGNPKMILFQGAIGNAYISLYSPRMSYKDEIGLITGVGKEEKKKSPDSNDDTNNKDDN